MHDGRCGFLDGLCRRPRSDPSHRADPDVPSWFQNVAHHTFVPPKEAEP